MKLIKMFTLLFVVCLVGCSENDNFLPKKGIKNQYQVAVRPAKLSLDEISANKWLQVIPDNLHISQLSIPGTHDSAALHEGFPNTAKCQSLDIDKQLEIGVRYLDVRCRHFKNKFTIHHGPVYQHKNFSDILRICKKFLKENPSEFIVMSIKQEHSSVDNNRSFYQTFIEYVKDEANGIFYTKATIPSVSEARGKIILMRRFKAPKNIQYGIQAYKGFKDNKSFIIKNETNELHIQDMYKVTDNNKKWDSIMSLFNESTQDKNPKKLYLNNISGYKSIVWIPNIKAVSNQLNRRLGFYLDDIKMSENKDRKLGIIGTDFMTPSQAKKIYTIQDF